MLAAARCLCRVLCTAYDRKIALYLVMLLVLRSKAAAVGPSLSSELVGF